MNRHARRSQERGARAARNTDATAIAQRIQSAAQEVQRLQAMLQHADAGGKLASSIPVVPVEGEVSVEDDPNFFRTAACEDFQAMVTATRLKLIGAHEEFYLAMEAADPAEQLITRVQTLVTP